MINITCYWENVVCHHSPQVFNNLTTTHCVCHSLSFTWPNTIAYSCKGATLPFVTLPGFWSLFTINSPLPNTTSVNTKAHMDHKSVPFGYCCVMALCNFDWEHKGWLVIPNVKQAWQIPPGSAILFPLSLFVHYNAKVVSCCQGDSIEFNAPAVDGSKEHFPCVWFVQGNNASWAKYLKPVMQLTLADKLAINGARRHARVFDPAVDFGSE